MATDMVSGPVELNHAAIAKFSARETDPVVRNHHSDMPRSRVIMQELLQAAEAELAQIEARLLTTVDADTASELVERAVDLTTIVLELKNELELAGKIDSSLAR
jgi:hypothetical protein